MSDESKFPEYAGRTEGGWTFLKFSKRAAGFDWWEAECAHCRRTVRLVRLEWVQRGISRGCGCHNARRRLSWDFDNLPPENLSESRYPEIRGQTFGRWSVKRFVERSAGFDFWLCECSCGVGGPKVVRAENLLSGKSKSCGCLGRENMLASRKKHGCSTDTVDSGYACWYGILQRCLNPKNTSYERYGGRGITVCEEWQGSGGFAKFIGDLGPRPSRDHSVDRIDADGPYNSGNCRWATRRQQSGNRRCTEVLEFRGESKPLSQWCREYGINVPSYKARLIRGWSVEKSLTTPLRGAWATRHAERVCPHCGNVIPSYDKLPVRRAPRARDAWCPTI